MKSISTQTTNLYDASLESAKWIRFECQFRRRQLQDWIVRTFMPKVHARYADLLSSHGEWQMRFVAAADTVKDLRAERAELTEVLVSLVAKDDDGYWTTVFDADTRLPVDYNELLNELVGRA